MKTWLFTFITLSFAICSVKAQNVIGNETKKGEQYEFIEIQGTTIVIPIYTYLNLNLTDQLKGNNQDNIVLLVENQELRPYASFFEFETHCSPKVRVMCIRTTSSKAQVIGYLKYTSQFILSLTEDKVAADHALRMICDYLGKAVKSSKSANKFGEIKKEMTEMECSEFIQTVLNDETVMRRVCDDTEKMVNKYAPVKCIAYNPETGAAIFQHSAANFIPNWKYMTMNSFIEKETGRKYDLISIKQADEEVKSKLHEDFIKKLDKYTK